MNVDMVARTRKGVFNLLSHDIPISSSKPKSYHPWEMQVEIEVVAEVFELVKDYVPCFVVCHATVARKNLPIAVCHNKAIFDKNILHMAKKMLWLRHECHAFFSIESVDFWPFLSYLKSYTSTHHSYAVCLMADDASLDVEEI